MAYNNGFPVNFPYYQQAALQQQPMMQQPTMQQMPQMMQPQPVQQMQQSQNQYPIIQSGFVRVRNENEARMYPVQPGNSVTFIDENNPYAYTKTVNMGQLDRPIFEKYRLVKEEDAPAPVEAPNKPVENQAHDLSQFAMKDDIRAFSADIEALKADLNAMHSDIEAFRGDLYGLAGKKKTTSKKEVTIDE